MVCCIQTTQSHECFLLHTGMAMSQFSNTVITLGNYFNPWSGTTITLMFMLGYMTLGSCSSHDISLGLASLN